MSRDYKDAPSFKERNKRRESAPIKAEKVVSSFRERSKRPDATPRKIDTPEPPWRWLIGGLGIGLVVAGFAYLILRPSHEEKAPKYILPEQVEAPVATESVVQRSPVVDTTKPAVAPVVAPDKKIEPPKPKVEAKAVEVKPEGPHYDFYTLLPKLAVEIPEQETSRGGHPTATALQAEAEQAPDKQPESYLLQAGSFRTSQDADRLKEKVVGLGLSAQVQAITGSNNDTWYRVRLGPYTDAKEMERVRKKLQDNKIEPMVVKIKQ